MFPRLGHRPSGTNAPMQAGSQDIGLQVKELCIHLVAQHTHAKRPRLNVLSWSDFKEHSKSPGNKQWVWGGATENIIKNLLN